MPDHSASSSPRWTLRDHPGLFDALREQALAGLKAVLGRTLDKADAWVFECLKKAPTYAPLLEAGRALRQSRGAFELAYLAELRQGFAALLQQVVPAGSEETELSLVDDDELVGLLASEVMVDAVNAAHELDIEVLSKRLAVMVGLRRLRPALNPLAAMRLAGALQSAQRQQPLPEAVRGPLFKIYERELIAALGPLLEALNDRLARAGILPGLDRPSEAIAEPEPEGPPLPPESVYVPENAPGVDVRESFNELRGLLHRRRPSPGAVLTAGAEDFGGLMVPSLQRDLDESEMVAVMSLMQPTVPSSVLRALSDSGAALAELIKQEILQSVGRIGLSPDQVRLTQDHEDAVDLVGMLFGVLFEEREFAEQPRRMLARLVIPFAKAAVMDLRMFQYTTHPARSLLNALAEALEGNRAEGQQERALLEKVEILIGRLQTQFNLSISIFATLLQDFRTFLTRHTSRVELAERRESELQRGRERLENARAQAARELRARVQGRSLPSAIDDFFSRLWSHHVAMVVLRDSDDSEAWRTAMAVADRLMALLARGDAAAGEVRGTLAAMSADLDAVLLSSGLTGDAASQVLAAVATELEHLPPIAPAASTSPPSADVIVLPTAQARAEKAQPSIESAIAAFIDQDADETALRALKIGDWIELVGSDLKTRPVKLSWVSPISNNMMFINRHGVRMLVASLQELVAMKQKGELLLRGHGQLFDHAMLRVKRRLEAEVAAAA